MDGVNKSANAGATFQRLLMDIEHLDLGKARLLHCLQPTCGITLGVLVMLQGNWSLSTRLMWDKLLESVNTFVELQLVSALHWDDVISHIPYTKTFYLTCVILTLKYHEHLIFHRDNILQKLSCSSAVHMAHILMHIAQVISVCNLWV